MSRAISWATRCGTVLALVLFPATMLEAQPDMLQRCVRRQITASSERNVLPTGQSVFFFRNGFEIRCLLEGRTIRSDSAHWYEFEQRLELFDNVSYQEKGTKITAGRMNYFRKEDRVLAQSNVRAELASGSTLVGQEVNYFVNNPALRRNEKMEATQRPRFVLVERDTVAGSADSTQVDANRIVVDGDEMYASGSVFIMRPDMDASADSIYGNRAVGRRTIKLIGRPGLRGKGEGAFSVTGTLIELEAGEDRQLKRVQALGKGNAFSPDFRLISDTVDMYLEKKVISRALAHGDSGATMNAQRNTMIGNRLVILMPGGKLASIDAFGAAKAEIQRDTTTIRTTVRDFVRGDTINVTFEEVITPVRSPALGAARTADSLAGAGSARNDTTTTPKSIIAIGNASIFYQRPEKDAAQKDCIISDYWLGGRITATLKGGDIDAMNIVGPVQGVSSDCKPVAPRRGPSPLSTRVPPR